MIDRIFAAPAASKNELEQGIAFAKQHGLDYEIPTFYHPEHFENLDAEIARHKALLEGFAGVLSLYGPLADLNVVSADADIARVSRQRYQQSIEIAKALNVRYLILHSQWSPLYTATGSAKNWLAKMTDFWEETIAEQLENTHITVLIENFLDPAPDHIVKLLSRLNSPHLKACLDTGHVNIFSTWSPEDWIRELGPQVAYIHAHNNSGEVDTHDAFDKGIIDMDSFLNHLSQLPQKIHLSIETATIEGLKDSYAKMVPYLELQNENSNSKSFLI